MNTHSSPESDPPHKIILYDVYYYTHLCCLFLFLQKFVSRKLFVLAFYQFWKGISAGLALNILHDSQGRAAPPKNGLIALWPSTNEAIPHIFALPGSEFSITEITKYTYLKSG